MKMLWGLAFALAALVSVSQAGVTRNCPECRREECPPLEARSCPAGVTYDECGCCEICTKAEFELCDHPEAAPSPNGLPYGHCGKNLECRMRSDLDTEEDIPQAHCVCLHQETLCGSDGVTYENLCQLAAAGINAQVKLTVENTGPCKQAPTIVSQPESRKEEEGTSVALVCEANGYPIPTIEWVWTRVDGKTVYLPSDDLHLAVNMRGGPEAFQVTGWLQVMEMEKKHEGDYTCIAQNEQGADQASARLNVITKDDKPY